MPLNSLARTGFSTLRHCSEMSMRGPALASENLFYQVPGDRQL